MPGPWELLLVLGIVLIIFGPKRLKNIGSDLGNAIKGFRSAVGDDSAKADDKPQEKVIEGEAGEAASGETETSESKA